MSEPDQDTSVLDRADGIGSVLLESMTGRRSKLKVLHIDSSIRRENSVSRNLTSSIVAALTTADRATEVIYHDLAAEPIDHLSGAEADVLFGAEPLDEVTRRKAALNAMLLDEFLSAEIVVIGAPMYNLSLPSQLKAWLDRLVIARKTFRYTADGVEGLVHGKRVIVASSRGGFYSEGYPLAFSDHQENLLRHLFNLLGITDIVLVRAEGLAVDAESYQAAVNAAGLEIEKLVL